MKSGRIVVSSARTSLEARVSAFGLERRGGGRRTLELGGTGRLRWWRTSS